MLFADFLNYAMEQANITNYKLAKHLNISQTTVANWLEGKTEPREKKRAEVLWLFGVSEKDIETGCPKILYRGEQRDIVYTVGGPVYFRSGLIPDAVVIPEQKEKSPAPEGAERIPGYSKLSETNRAIVDSMIAQLLAAQSED